MKSINGLWSLVRTAEYEIERLVVMVGDEWRWVTDETLFGVLDIGSPEAE